MKICTALLTTSLLFTACADPATQAGDDDGAPSAPRGGATGGKADGAGYTGWYVTASTVQALGRDMGSVEPAVTELFPGDPLSIEAYLAPMSCLGYYGPVGPWGPLGVSGPVGENAWNPGYYVSGEGALAWSDWAETLTELNGPLSAEGPLGMNGPVGDAYYDEGLIGGDFDRQLRGGGVFTVLGPIGPLGALGPLGPLGPVGGHGYRRDAKGRYLNGSKVVRSVDVPFGDGTTRRYPLFEEYTEAFAKADTGNDTSFMVHGLISPSSETDTYKFKSAEDQIVTLLVVPESASMFTPQAMGVLWAASLIGYEYPPVAPTPRYTTDDFDLRVEDSTGRVLAASSSRDAADWIQIRVPASASLRAKVTMKSTWDYWGVSPTSRKYRLFVVGSTANLADVAITGDHRLEVVY